jgi:hypothetical protein
MATGGGAGRFPVTRGGGVGQGRWLERHSKVGDPFGGSGEEGCSPVNPSMAAWFSGGEHQR